MKGPLGELRRFIDEHLPGTAERDELERIYEGLDALINRPEIEDFARGAVLEAAHQRERWESAHDSGKSPFDWFWLIGYLAQKAAAAAVAGDLDKALHHTISTAAALANWHLALRGVMGSPAELLEAALGYAARGWPVFPCNPKNKQPLLAAKKDEHDKPIRGTGGVSAASTDPDQIRAWWKKWPKALIGLATGHPTTTPATSGSSSSTSIRARRADTARSGRSSG
jgi:hypothetical protein